MFPTPYTLCVLSNRQLAQASECLESIHWTLKQNVIDGCNSMLGEKVLKPLAILKHQSVETQKVMQVRKQKVIESFQAKYVMLGLINTSRC